MGRITACSQLVEGVVGSRLPATPSPEPPLPSSDSCSAFQPSGTCWLYPEVFSPLLSSEVSRNCSLLCPSDIIVYPLVCPFKRLPSVPHALCTQAQQPSLPTLCSLNYQVLCSVSLLILVGGTSLSDRVFTVPRGNHYLFPKGDLFYPLTFPQKLLYNLLQGFSRSSLKPPESRSESGPEILSSSYVISNELPRRFCRTGQV